jgi:type I restriction enzyme M protein
MRSVSMPLVIGGGVGTKVVMAKLSLAKLERHLYAAADRLRQEGLDAATYKDYIFGMLFLKRCSDVFDAERQKIVGRKVEQGMIQEEAEAQYRRERRFL